MSNAERTCGRKRYRENSMNERLHFDSTFFFVCVHVKLNLLSRRRRRRRRMSCEKKNPTVCQISHLQNDESFKVVFSISFRTADFSSDFSRRTHTLTALSAEIRIHGLRHSVCVDIISCLTNR